MNNLESFDYSWHIAENLSTTLLILSEWDSNINLKDLLFKRKEKEKLKRNNCFKKNNKPHFQVSSSHQIVE